ncbi:hypothetical protein HNP24_000781 [Chryseobacterium sediminis]|uniref:Apea-like HEPN domain-containing protein n=1 Tax=Chryseobacterium sediminis TaxID=1679494 RepID=A0ABR6PVV6_9FLAO|nr:hypothetical protein [Chryseobacterium sediminis]MBB6329831.1 hypothetical protein [Chryseobacterium sediminis]
MKDDFAIKWLKTRFKNEKINEKDIRPVLHFSLLWNFFESMYFTADNQLSARNLVLLSRLSLSYLTPEVINKNFEYFKSRYFAEASTNGLFESLNLSTTRSNELGSSFKIFCENTIINEHSELEDKLIVLFLIIHRYRNNLFHGRKQTLTLNIYKKQFKIINEFLIDYFNATVDNDCLNKNRF